MMQSVLESGSSDHSLVVAAQTGDRQAFGQIVGRYQTLICSIAYATLGDLTQSEDCAQETFLAAWKDLRTLREPGKLRGWLSGIARNLANNSVRRRAREKAFAAEESAAIEVEAPSESMMSEEEERLLWRSLERLPETYREPLILFYREGESISRVSEALELSEDAVKQRLSRGRKLLQAEVASYVESTLRRTRPGKAFTAAVVAALPGLGITASAATVGTASAKGAAVQAGAGSGLFGAVLGPILGFLGAYVGAKASLDSAQSQPEKRFVWKMIWIAGAGTFVFAGLFFLLLIKSGTWQREHPGLFVVALIGAILAQLSFLLSAVYWGNRMQQRIRREQGQEPADGEKYAGYEYRSPLKLLSLPLIHIKFGNPLGLGRGPAKGWIAIGDTSIGILFAAGGVAIGGIATGGLALGGISLAGAAFGVLALGGWAMGYEAAGGGVLAWHAAFGGLAVAFDLAQGGLAIATHANDPTAIAYFQKNWFFTFTRLLSHPWSSLVLISPLLVISLVKGRSRKGREHRGLK